MTEKTADQLVMDLMNLQARIQKRTGGALSAHGLGLSDYFVLNQLYISPSQKMRRNELAERVGLSPSGITRLLNPLEKIGLVEKESNPRDARVSLVTLSVQGKRVYEEAKVSFSEVSRLVFEPLDATQRSNFAQLLKALL
ncbi:MAG: MarR family transcriptional regulator [Gammaproteobacteria bacterium]|nr:MarR family transcriptional regulator [Pseudomonadales bacterium]